MLNAVKESMKNWLKSHERLYWYIVVGIAVLAFGIITAVGCAKLERAEAAEETLKVNWKGQEVYFPLGNYPYYVIIKDFAEYGDFVIVSYDKLEYFYNSPRHLLGTYFENGSIDKSGTISRMYGYRNNEDYLTTYQDAYGFAIGDTLPSALNVISNYDICDAITGDVVYNATRFEQYSPDAPYLENVNYSNVNLFLIDGNTDFNESTFRFVFDIADDGLEYIGRTAKLSGYVYLPSKDFIDKAVQYYMGGRPTLDAYYSIYSCDEYPNWLKSIDLGDGSSYKKWAISFDVECGNNLDLHLSHEQIYQLIEEFNGIDLREYYGIDDVAFIDHILKGYMWVHRIDGYLSTTYSDSIKYGNLTSFVISTYLKNPVVVVGNSDPLFVGPMLPDSDVQQNLNQAYKDALEQAIKENEELNDTMGGIYDADGAFGNLEGSDLWTGFGSLSKGLSSLGPSIRSLSSLTGSVFAFIPAPIANIISFSLLAICIIAIIKAIRG